MNYVSTGFIRKLHKFNDIRKDVGRPNTSGGTKTEYDGSNPYYEQIRVDESF